MDEIFAEVKKPPLDQSFLRNPRIRKYFPKSYSDEKVADVSKIIICFRGQFLYCLGMRLETGGADSMSILKKATLN